MIETTDAIQHWSSVWAEKKPHETSWFQDVPEPCSRLVRSVSTPSSRVVIVGAGATRLVADLLAHGYTSIEAVDIATPALERLADELGAEAARVRRRQADVRTLLVDEPVDVWHDRATFHFLVNADDRRAYASRCAESVRAGSYAVVAAFSLDGPDQCSGLPVRRYDAASLAAEFSGSFDLVASVEHEHLTPWGSRQPFVYVVLHRTSDR